MRAEESNPPPQRSALGDGSGESEWKGEEVKRGMEVHQAAGVFAKAPGAHRALAAGLWGQHGDMAGDWRGQGRAW